MRTGKTLDLTLALLDNGDVEHAQVGVNDAAADGLALALAGAALAVRLLA